MSSENKLGQGAQHIPEDTRHTISEVAMDAAPARVPLLDAYYQYKQSNRRQKDVLRYNVLSGVFQDPTAIPNVNAIVAAGLFLDSEADQEGFRNYTTGVLRELQTTTDSRLQVRLHQEVKATLRSDSEEQRAKAEIKLQDKLKVLLQVAAHAGEDDANLLTRSQIAQNILHNYVESTESQDEVVELLYQMWHAVLDAEDPEVEKYAVRLFRFDPGTENVFSLKSKAIALFNTGAKAVDDATLQKFHNLDQAHSQIAAVHAMNPQEGMADRLAISFEHPAFRSFEERNYSPGSQRLADLTEFDAKSYERHVAWVTQISEDPASIARPYPFPEEVIFMPDPLRDKVNKRLQQQYDEEGLERQIATLTLPDGRDRIIPIDRSAYAHNTALWTYHALQAEPEVYGVEPKLSNERVITSTLEHLRPEFDEENNGFLQLYAQQLKDDVSGAKVSVSVSLSGDEVKVVDPLLTQEGIAQMTFENGKRNSVKVSVRIGNYTIPLTLDKTFALKDASGAELPISPEAKAWWETVTLAHLRKIVCPEKSGVRHDSQGEDVAKEQAESSIRRFHKVQLPPPKQYTLVQEVLARGLAGIELYDYNVQRGRTVDTGYITWALPNVRLAFESAFPDIWRIVRKEGGANDRDLALLGQLLIEQRDTIIDYLSKGEPIKSTFRDAMDEMKAILQIE